MHPQVYGDLAQAVSTGGEESVQQAASVQFLEAGAPALGGGAEAIEDARVALHEPAQALQTRACCCDPGDVFKTPLDPSVRNRQGLAGLNDAAVKSVIRHDCVDSMQLPADFRGQFVLTGQMELVTAREDPAIFVSERVPDHQIVLLYAQNEPQGWVVPRRPLRLVVIIDVQLHLPNVCMRELLYLLPICHAPRDESRAREASDTPDRTGAYSAGWKE
jgi:hypothetical protein